MFHSFNQSIQNIEIPKRLNCPFYYQTHPLCLLASNEVIDYVSKQEAWKKELESGKMFGVLIVENDSQSMGFIAAFSGNINGRNNYEFFVPPICDLTQQDGFYKTEERNISHINQSIEQLKHNVLFQNLKVKLKELNTSAQKEIEEYKQLYKLNKEERKQIRLNKPSPSTIERLNKESQFQKAEIKRLEKRWSETIDSVKSQIQTFEDKIKTLENERKHRSALLQEKLFNRYTVRNAKGEQKSILDVFKEYNNSTPPGGTGECAAPKLFQYAYLNRLRPIAIAEFWYGGSPHNKIRHHGCFYPACKSKCEPLLHFMLQGLEVEENLLRKESLQKIDVLYEDNWLLIVNKPEGMLSVPGKEKQQSLFSMIKERHPEYSGPIVVHRLDMATSGILLLTKDKETHKRMQLQFRNRTIQKKYIAVLDGLLKSPEGVIKLPLSPDYEERPKQTVDCLHGKEAITRYKEISNDGKQTRVAFYPITGRTHQLRVHAAHRNGLAAPIVGDSLYGATGKRLLLHASELTFEHPYSGKIVTIACEPDF